MRRYAVQLAGGDCAPVGDWEASPVTAVLALQASDDYDLLVEDLDGETCEIYAQVSLAELTNRLEHTAYARLLAQMMHAYADGGRPLPAQLQRQWYLVADLAVLSHQSLLNTAAALLSLTVVASRPPRPADPRRLRGLADQARCWLLAANVTPLQLVATDLPLRTLLDYLTRQTSGLNAGCAGGRSRSGQLANDAWTLSQQNLPVEKLQLPAAWTLIRAAALERFEH